jgi:hypothetical protein
MNKDMSIFERIRDFLGIPRQIASIRKSIEEQTSAIRDEYERERKRQHAQPEIKVFAELHTPEAVESDRGTRDDRQHCLQVWLTVGTWLAFFAAAIYAGIAGVQTYFIREANNISQQSLVAVQRAFMGNRGTGSKRYLNTLPDGNRWLFDEEFFNDGSTPAIAINQMMNFDEIIELTEDRFIGKKEMLDSAKENVGSANPRSPYIIGPMFKTDEFVLGAEGIDFKNIKKTKATKITRKMYVWGWVVYRDIFPNTPVHLTEFCQQLAGITVDSKEDTLSVSFTNCKNHNCTDEYCHDYKEVVAAVSSPNTSPDPFGIDKIKPGK